MLIFRFRDLDVAQKLAVGFGAIVVIIGAIVALTVWELRQIGLVDKRLVEIRVPTAEAAKSIVNGVNHAQAALRGWMLLGEETFKEERVLAWKEQILQPLDNLFLLSADWANEENTQLLMHLRRLIVEFDAVQKEIEELANTPDNIPAYKVLVEEAAPQVAIQNTLLTAIIDLETEQPATATRKDLLYQMTKVQGSLALTASGIRAFLLTGDPRFHERFEFFWQQNNAAYDELIRRRNLLTSQQQVAFEPFIASREIFASLPEQMISMRAQDDWNVGNYLLATKAAPAAAEIKRLGEGLIAVETELLDADTQLVAHLVLRTEILTAVLGFTAILASLLLGWVIARSITKPLRSVISSLNEISAGDFTHSLDVKSKDEFGHLSETVNSLVGNLRGMMNNVQTDAEKLASASEHLSDVSRELASHGVEMKNQSETATTVTGELSSTIINMAAGVEEMSVSANSVSSSAEQMSRSTNSVSATVKQMSDSLDDIANNAKTASGIATEAQDLSTSASGTMDTLGSAAVEIGLVTDAIKRIAERTNLLALNATIEAASAGAAGSGFAVVANEIKELANQSGEAAGDINDKIGDVQQKTQDAVDVIEKVSNIIAKITESVSSITYSVDQQSSATREIAVNVSEAAGGVTDIAQSIQQVSATADQLARSASGGATATNEVSSTIQDVNTIVEENTRGVTNISDLATDLAALSGNLKNMVARYVVN